MSMKPYRNAAIAALFSLLLEGVCVAYRASDIGHRLSELPRFLMKALLSVAVFPLPVLDRILPFSPHPGNVGMLGLMLVGPVFWGTLVLLLSRWRLMKRMRSSEPGVGR